MTKKHQKPHVLKGDVFGTKKGDEKMKLSLKIMIVMHNDNIGTDKMSVLRHYKDEIEAEQRRIEEAIEYKTGDLEKHIQNLKSDYMKLRSIEDWDTFRDNILNNDWILV